MRTQRSGSQVKTVVLGTALAMTAALLAGCTTTPGGDSTPTAGPTVTVKVGDVNSLTGALAQTGLQSVCAALVLVDAINNDNYVPGIAIDYAVEDDQSTAATAVQAATKLTDEGYNFITGGVTGSMIQPRVPVTNDAGALDTLGLSQSLEVVQSANITIHPGPVGTQSGAAVADLVGELKAKSIAYINVDSPYGNSSVQATKDAVGSNVKDLGTVVVPPSDTDLSDEATKIASLEPDVVVVFLAGGPASVDFYSRISTIAPDVKIIAGPGLLTPDFVKAAGDAVEGAYTANTFPPTTTNAANDAFLAQWDKYSGDHNECRDQVPSSSGATAWSNVYLIAAGVAAAGSDDPQDVKDAVVGATWTLPAGEVSFEPDGSGNPPFSFFVVEDGELTAATF